jgi:uncharacterized membrane protein
MQNKSVEPHKSSIGGLDANLMALLIILITAVFAFIPGLRYICWVLPLVMYFIETQSEFVRFQSLQTLVLYAINAAVLFVVDVIVRGVLFMSFYNPFAVLGVSGLFGLIELAVGITVLVFAILAMVNVYKYVDYRVPFIGPIVSKAEDIFKRN